MNEIIEITDYPELLPLDTKEKPRLGVAQSYKGDFNNIIL